MRRVRRPNSPRSFPPLPLLGWLLLAVALSTATGALAADPLRLDGGFREADLAPHLRLHRDDTATLGLDGAIALAAQGGFSAPTGQAPSFGFSDAAFWLYLPLRNTATEPLHLVLRQSYPLLDHLEVWQVEGGRVLRHWRTGDRLPFASRPIEHRDFLIPLELPAGAEQSLYLRATSSGPVNLPLTLHEQHALTATLGGEQLLLGALFGSIALLAVCVALLYAFVRDAAFLHYLLYVSSYGCYMAVFNGIAYQYAWPQSPLLGSALQSVFLLLALLFLVLFSRSLLRVPLHSPRLDWSNRLLLALIGALLLLAPFHDYAVLVRPISLAVLWAMAMVLAMGFAGWRAGEPTARYYLLAWSAFVAGVVAYMLKSFGLLPHGFLTQYGFQIGTIFEFILLSVALGIRVQQLRQQSRTDALTGLANRSRFDELIEGAFAQHTQGAPLALLVIDVDHFKRVNDEHGHVTGDRVLQRVADQLRRALQRPQQACRYGGEEFAILLPRTDLARACEIAEALRRDVAADRREPAVSISIGVACTAGARHADPRALFRAADEALYAAKRGGRNRVVAAEAGGVVDALPATAG